MQRIPRNGGGRRHTSTATVAVLTGRALESVKVDERDVRVDTSRGHGAGGQHRNVTDSAVRVTHLPTGVVVTSEAERSQRRNRQAAFAELERRLQVDGDARRAVEVNGERRRQVIADRAAKTFTHSQQRSEVTGDGRRWRWRDFYRGRI